jgi:hypothetical protein
MTAKKGKQPNNAKRKEAARSSPPLKGSPKGAATRQPGGGEGRVDVTGIMPEGVHVDPNLTEGHPGYEESGDSEIIPIERLARGGATEEKGSG